VKNVLILCNQGEKMKKLIILWLLLSALAFAADDGYSSDDDDYVKVPVNIGLWPGISTGDMWAEEAGYKKVYNTGFALSLIGMRAARLRGMDFSGIFSIYTEGVQGVQASGIFNIVNGNVAGVQAAGIFTIVDGDVKGIQANGIFGVQNGEFKGVQGTTIFNIQNGDFTGLQSTGIFTIQNGNFKGAQFSGVFAIQNGDFTGGQFSQIFNIQNGDFRGVQLSSSLNIVGGSFRGFQAATVNIARRFDRGLQVGIVNVAEEHYGVPVGLVTIVEDVPFGYDVWYDNLQFVNIGLRSGNDDYYNLISVGRRIEGDIQYYTIGGGFGKKIYLGDNWNMDLGINIAKLLNKHFKDGTYENFIWKNSKLGYISRFNLVFRYGLNYRSNHGQGSIFIGPTINMWVSKLETEDLTKDLWVDEKEDNNYIRVWPGFVVGVEL
jgi:hypothetical protein